MGISEELLERLQLGLKRYNHGVRVDDDTRTWGTQQNSWMEMAKEELLDAIIYTIADYIRSSRNSSCPCELHSRQGDDDNKLIISILDNFDYIKSPEHKLMLCNLFKMLNSDLFNI
jgi:ferredoxin-thioredoxin reductase catalytic subunit